MHIRFETVLQFPSSYFEAFNLALARLNISWLLPEIMGTAETCRIIWLEVWRMISKSMISIPSHHYVFDDMQYFPYKWKWYSKRHGNFCGAFRLFCYSYTAFTTKILSFYKICSKFVLEFVWQIIIIYAQNGITFAINKWRAISRS